LPDLGPGLRRDAVGREQLVERVVGQGRGDGDGESGVVPAQARVSGITEATRAAGRALAMKFTLTPSRWTTWALSPVRATRPSRIGIRAGPHDGSWAEWGRGEIGGIDTRAYPAFE